MACAICSLSVVAPCSIQGRLYHHTCNGPLPPHPRPSSLTSKSLLSVYQADLIFLEKLSKSPLSLYQANLICLAKFGGGFMGVVGVFVGVLGVVAPQVPCCTGDAGQAEIGVRRVEGFMVVWMAGDAMVWYDKSGTVVLMAPQRREDCKEKARLRRKSCTEIENLLGPYAVFGCDDWCKF